MYKRLLTLPPSGASAFIFGPRMTGKTTLLSGWEHDLFIDLLDPELELKYRAHPREFWEQISAYSKGSKILVDEIQKVPS